VEGPPPAAVASARPKRFDAAHPSIADTHDLLAVGSQDQIDIGRACAQIGKRFFHGLHVVDREVHATRRAAFMVITLRRQAQRHIVEHRNHFTQVFREQAVEEHFVACVQTGEERVLAQRIRQAIKDAADMLPALRLNTPLLPL